MSPRSRLRGIAVSAIFLSAAPSLSAAIVSHSANATTPIGTSYDDSGIWLDFFTGSVITKESGSGYLTNKAGLYQLNFSSVSNWLSLLDRSNGATSAAWTNNTLNGVERLGFGQMVDASDVYSDIYNVLASADSYDNEWDGFGRGVIGVRFTNEASEVFYGYMDITVNPNYTATLNGFAYQNVAGTGIVTGAVPEPSTLGLVGLSVLVICGRRRAA